MSLLLKKLLIANVLGAGIITPIVKYTRPQTPIEQLELESTLKKWSQLFNKISGNTDFDKLSSLFSRNLTSFSKSAVVNTVKQLLMRWVIQIWENQEAFFPISQRLNKFFFYYHIHHWKMKNEVEELSWDLIKKFFIDFFFKEKGWFLLSQFGDFSSFVLKEWEKREKPMKIYEWALKYSNAGDNKQISSDSESLYNKSTMEKVKNKVPFLFPEIQESEEYSSFISKLIHKREVELSKFKKKWVTLSELKKLTDGYKLGALIHLFGTNNTEEEEEEEEGELENETQDEAISELKLKNEAEAQNPWEPVNNPLYLFLDEKENDNCLLIQNSLFKEEIQEKLKGKNGTFCLYSARWLSSGNGKQNGKTKKRQKVLASREQEGISFYYLAGDSKLQGTKESKKTIDEQDSEVIEKVTQYLTDNFETIFFQYLLSKNTSDEFESKGDFTPFTLQPINKDQPIKIKDWNFSDFLNEHLTILKASSDYLESLYWAQTLKTLQTILLSVYKHTPTEIEFKKSSENSDYASDVSETPNGNKKIQLSPTSGLFSPLSLKRSEKPEEASKELDFFELRSKENNSQEAEHKSFFFNELTNFLFGKKKEKDLFSLEKKASELRKLLSRREENNIFKDSSLKDLFLNNLFLRAQLEDLTGNENTNSISSIFSLKAEEIIFSGDKGISERKDSFSELLDNYINSLKTEAKGEASQQTEVQEGENTTWTDLIKESIFLEPFLKSPTEKKILYGTLDIESSENSKSEFEINEESVSDKQKLITKARNHWLLNNYYFSDSAYESSSAEYKKFLSFLLAVKWMVKNDYSNLPRLINYILKKNENKNAYLLWFREITEKEKEKLEESQEVASKPSVTSASVPNVSATTPTSPQEQLKEFLRETFSTDISNPLLKSKFTLETNIETGVEESTQRSSETEKKAYSPRNTIYNIDAYKDKNGKNLENQNKLTQLSGFVGLVTESFETREIPQSLKNYIFKSFLSSNSSKNINYSAKNQTNLPAESSEGSELIEGAFFPHNTKRSLKNNTELLNLLDKAKKKEVLLKFLNDDKSLNSLRIALGEQEREINNLTLKKLKDELIKSLSESNIQKVDISKDSRESKLIKELYRLFNRFSGYLYVSDDKEKSPYVFTETKESSSEKKYYIGFLYQVNQFDFEKEGIKELKQALSEKTLHTLISLLASNEEIREWIYEMELTKQLFLS